MDGRADACAHCGVPLVAAGRFCSNCGAPVAPVTLRPAAPVPPVGGEVDPEPDPYESLYAAPAPAPVPPPVVDCTDAVAAELERAAIRAATAVRGS